MYVSLRLVGQIKVNNEGDILYVHTPGSDVSGDQDWEAALAEPFQGPIPLGLRTVSVDSLSLDVLLVQKTSELVGPMLGPGKDNRKLSVTLLLQTLHEKGTLIRPIKEAQFLANIFSRSFFRLNRNGYRITEDRLSEAHYLLGHCRRKEK